MTRFWSAKGITTIQSAGERREAFEQLSIEHARSIYGAALRMTRNPDDAQDLAQDALVRAFSAFDSFTPGTNFRAWAFRILTNLYISQCRSRRQNLVQLDDHIAGMEENLQDVSNSTPELLLQCALDEEIEQALARLSNGIRLAVLLVDVEGLSYEEAADALAIPVGTVRSRLNRGRELLRGHLAGFARDRRRTTVERSSV